MAIIAPRVSITFTPAEWEALQRLKVAEYPTLSNAGLLKLLLAKQLQHLGKEEEATHGND